MIQKVGQEERAPRVAMAARVRVAREDLALDGDLVNVSRSGALVALAQEIELGVFYSLTLTAEGRDLTLFGEAVRLHLPKEGANRIYQVGFAFLARSADTAHELAELLHLPE